MSEFLHGALRIVELLVLAIAARYVLILGPVVMRSVVKLGFWNMVRGAVKAYKVYLQQRQADVPPPEDVEVEA